MNLLVIEDVPSGGSCRTSCRSSDSVLRCWKLEFSHGAEPGIKFHAGQSTRKSEIKGNGSLSSRIFKITYVLAGYAMKKVRSQRLRVLKHITDPSFNFKNYRIISKHQSKSLPCEIPFVSLLVKDACFQAEEIRKLGQEAPLPTEKLFHAFSQTALPLSKLYERKQNPPSQKVLFLVSNSPTN